MCGYREFVREKMQTFLPYPDFGKSAFCLDRKRLGKQRVEALTILKTLLGINKGWINHPAVKMWRGYEGALALYGLAICEEWTKRGYQDSCRSQIEVLIPVNNIEQMPFWLGNESFHSCHRATLLFKNSGWYGGFGWIEYPKKQYYWPV